MYGLTNSHLLCNHTQWIEAKPRIFRKGGRSEEEGPWRLMSVETDKAYFILINSFVLHHERTKHDALELCQIVRCTPLQIENSIPGPLSWSQGTFWPQSARFVQLLCSDIRTHPSRCRGMPIKSRTRQIRAKTRRRNIETYNWFQIVFYCNLKTFSITRSKLTCPAVLIPRMIDGSDCVNHIRTVGIKWPWEKSLWDGVRW